MRRVVWLMGLVALTMFPLGGTTARAEVEDPLVSASNSLYSCIQTADTLAVEFVMDRSRSLRTNDPDGVRFEGMRTALAGLANITRPDGESLAVEVAIASFNDSYQSIKEVVGWTRINTPDSAMRIDQVVTRAENRMPPQGGTDFERALNGGLDDFQSRLTPGTCKVMLWFTDGEFHNARGGDLTKDPEDATAKIEAARQEMCATPSGVVARIRAAGIVLIGLQLGEQSDDLRQMSTGTLNGQSCGPYPVPEGQAPGGYLEASDVGDLSWVFVRMGDLVRGCTATGALGGLIDPGIHQMVVRVKRPTLRTAPGKETLTLRAPDGTQIVATVPGRVEVQGYTVQSDRDASQLGALVTFPDGRGDGTWSIDPGFAPKDSGVTYCVMSGLSLRRAADAASPRAGTESTLTATVQNHRGASADLSVYSSVKGDATVTADGVLPSATVVAKDGTVRTIVTPGRADARLSVTLRVSVTTRSGLALPPLTLAYATGVLSDDFPEVRPADRLDLGTAVRLTPASASLTLVGAKNGPSQVCLGEPRQEESARSDGVLSYQAQCFPLAASEERLVPVTLTPQRELVGQGHGVIPVTLVSAARDQASDTKTFDLPVVWRYDIPADPWILYGILALTLIVTAGFIWAALYLAHLIASRYTTANLRVAVVDVWLTEDGLRRATPHRRFPEALVADDDYRALPRRPRRRITQGSATLIAKTPLLPWRGSEFYAEPASGNRIVSNQGLGSVDGTWAPTDPSLENLILITAPDHAIREAGEGPLRATLMAFTTQRSLPRVSPTVVSAHATRSRWQRAIALAGSAASGDAAAGPRSAP